MYQLKRYGLPAMYWNGMLKGRVKHLNHPVV